MSRAGHQDMPYQRKLAAAFHYAAHDLAARVHEEAAERYDEQGRRADAEHERQMAVRDRFSAVAARAWAAMKGHEAGPQAQERGGVDLAALLGATIALLLTLTNGPGAWGPLSTIIGLLLLVVLLAFFWGRRPKKFPWQDLPAKHLNEPTKPRWRLFFDRDFFVGFALSVVVAFVAAITLAQPIQWLAFSDKYNHFECRSAAVAQATAAVRDLSDAHANTQILQRLINVTLNRNVDEWSALESGQPPVIGNTTKAHTSAVAYAFVHQYEASVGDCLAGETIKSLWWVAGPCLGLTLLWWYLNAIKASKTHGTAGQY